MEKAVSWPEPEPEPAQHNIYEWELLSTGQESRGRKINKKWLRVKLNTFPFQKLHLNNRVKFMFFLNVFSERFLNVIIKDWFDGKYRELDLLKFTNNIITINDIHWIYLQGLNLNIKHEINDWLFIARNIFFLNLI